MGRQTGNLRRRVVLQPHRRLKVHGFVGASGNSHYSVGVEERFLAALYAAQMLARRPWTSSAFTVRHIIVSLAGPRVKGLALNHDFLL